MLCLSDFELYSRWVPLDYRKRAENLHKHAHAEILQTDTFTLEISSQKGASPCAGKKFLYQRKEERFKSFFYIRVVLRKIEGAICTYLKPSGVHGRIEELRLERGTKI